MVVNRPVRWLYMRAARRERPEERVQLARMGERSGSDSEMGVVAGFMFLEGVFCDDISFNSFSSFNFKSVQISVSKPRDLAGKK